MFESGYAVDVEDVESVRAARRTMLDRIYDERRQAEFAFDFGATPASIDIAGVVGVGPAGVQTLQMRDTAANPDLRNWVSLQSNNGIRLFAGQGGAKAPMKVTSNVWVQTTVEQAAGVLGAVFANQAAHLDAYGRLKAQIASAADVAALDAIDVEAGWP